MLNGYSPEQAVDALLTISATIEHDTRVRVGMAFKDAGGQFDDYDAWQSTNPRYDAIETRSMWNSYTDGPVKARTLFSIAKDHGWTPTGNTTQQAPQKPHARTTRPPEPPRKPFPGNGPAEVFERCVAATAGHGYVARKQIAGDILPLLRVVAGDDPLSRYRGWLAVPGHGSDGTLQTIEFIAADGQKMTLKGSHKSGASFTVGPATGAAVVVEGLGAASAAYMATGLRSISCFGSGNIKRVVEALRQREPETLITIAPDRGKELDAQRISTEFGCSVAYLPEAEPSNFDINDLGLRDGFDAVELLLSAATAPPKPEPRYKLLNSADIAAMPPLAWRVRGVLPAVGLAGLYGPSASGKSFLALDMAAAIAEARRWFDCRVEAAPVVYVALEGEAGFKLRTQAWEAHYGRTLPTGLQMVLQPFKLTEPRDVHDLAAVIPPGAVVFLDTLNRAAPTADENSSKDMGEILEAAKLLQTLTGGLVVLVHHTGKDLTKGLRGHSSLFAAMDAAVEVWRDGDRREWKVAKAKDGQDGDAHPFKLEVETLGVDEHGDPVTSCTVRADTSIAEVQRVRVPQGGNQKLVYDGIRGMFKDGISGKPGAPPLRPCIELEAAVTAGAARLTCASDKRTSRARDAIAGLVSRGVLGLNEGFLWTV